MKHKLFALLFVAIIAIVAVTQYANLTPMDVYGATVQGATDIHNLLSSIGR